MSDQLRVARVRLDDVLFHPHNVRRDLGDLRALASSIKRFGVMQPIVVEDYGDGLRLRAGHRRCAAARLAGLERVPAVIHAEALDDDEWLMAAMHENVMRRGLSEGERRDVLRKLHDELGCTWAGLAEQLGVSPATVQSWAADPRKAKSHGRRLTGGQVRAFVRDWQRRPDATAAEVLAALEVLLSPTPLPLVGDEEPRDRCEVDEVAVQRAVSGHAPERLSIAEREEAVRRLHARGHNDQDIARITGFADRTVLRIRQRLDLPAVAVSA